RGLDEIGDTVAVRVEGLTPQRPVNGVRGHRGDQEGARVARLAQVVRRRRQSPLGRRQRIAVEMAEGRQKMRPVVTDAVKRADRRVVLILRRNALQAELKLEALEVAARQEVDDAG